MELARRCTDFNGKINYQAMAEQLNGRDVLYVQKCFSDMKRCLVVYEKTGRFLPEEDAIIISRVQSGETKKGFWVNLAKELGGRNPNTLCDRWRHNLSKRSVAASSVAATAAAAIPTVAAVTVRSQVNSKRLAEEDEEIAFTQKKPIQTSSYESMKRHRMPSQSMSPPQPVVLPTK